MVRLTEGKRNIPAMEDKIDRELDGLLADLMLAGYSEFPPTPNLSAQPELRQPWQVLSWG